MSAEPADFLSPPPPFLTWHYTDGLTRVLRIWRNILEFFYHYFSIAHHLSTLFAPFKRMHRYAVSPQSSGAERLERIVLNSFSRIFGIVARLTVVTAGILCLITGVVLGFCIVILWFFVPFLTYPLYASDTKWRRKVYRLTFGPEYHQELEKVLSSRWGTFFLTRMGLTKGTIIAKALMDKEIHAHADPLYFRDPSEAFLAILYRSDSVSKYLALFGMTREDVVFVTKWFWRLRDLEYRRKAFWKRDNLLHRPSIGSTWTYGYTPILDKYTVDLSSLPIPFSQFLGRSRELTNIEQMLAKRVHANALLVGEAGLGKRPLLIFFAHKVAEGRVLPELVNKRVILLNLDEFFTRQVDVVQRKSTLASMFAEADSAGNIVLVIDKFERFLTSGPDRIDVTQLLTETLSHNHLRIIGVMRPGAYLEHVKSNKILSDHFGVIELKSLSRDETLLVVSSVIESFEDDSRYFTYDSIREIVSDADKYIKDVPFPEKAINIVDQISSFAIAHNIDGPINIAQVKQYIGSIVHVPLDLTIQDRTRLAHLEDTFHKRIVGQTEAAGEIIRTLNHIRTNIANRKDKPIATFLFLGGVGVGKSETAAALAEGYFGSLDSFLHFDMSEYQDVSSTRLFLGDFVTGKPGEFVRKVNEQPFAVLLLENLNKANGQLRDSLLQALDSGLVTDAFGKKIILKNMIVVASVSAGSELIAERTAQGVSREDLRKEIVEYIRQKQILPSEFVNKFDAETLFYPITKDQTRSIIELAVDKLKAIIKRDQGINLMVTEKTKNQILENGYDAVLGGRALHRAIGEYIEQPLAQKVREGTAIRGSTVEI